MGGMLSFMILWLLSKRPRYVQRTAEYPEKVGQHHPYRSSSAESALTTISMSLRLAISRDLSLRLHKRATTSSC